MALIATTIHPKTKAVVEYREAKGIAMMEQRWSSGEKYILPRAWLKGLLADIRKLGGKVEEYEANLSVKPDPSRDIDPWSFM